MREILLHGGGVALRGDLAVPSGASGLVLFAHGSGSGRKSSRNQFVAETLRAHGVGTLLFDLLTEDEERAEARTRHLRFDIGLLAGRLAGATDWALADATTRELRVGYFGASTGAAAALVAASRRDDIGAIVSRGGRPDLAGAFLRSVRAPTLLIVGGNDGAVVEMNEEAYAALRCERELVIVPGATHLFEEAGTLEDVARRAAAWFVRHLAR